MCNDALVVRNVFLQNAVGYTSDIVYFSWLDNAVEINEDLQLPQFELKDTHQRDCSQNYTAGTCTVADISKIAIKSFCRASSHINLSVKLILL